MKKNKIQIFRIIIQVIFLIVVTVAAIRHQVLGGGPKGSPPVDAICPFGGIEALYNLIISGQFIDKLDYSNIALLIGTIILVVILGRYFCGWICALGTMQEIFAKIGYKIFKKKFEIPKSIDKYLRYLKYVVLIWAIYFTWKTGTLFIRPYDPFAAYAHIFAGFDELIKEFLIGVIILILSLILSIFYDRVFCKYLCPLGAFLGILSKISFFKIKRENTTCISCNLCNKKCPVNIEVSKVEEVKSAECIACFECVTNCPTNKDTLKTTILKKPLNIWIVAILGLAIYVGVIVIANIAGYWKTTKTLEEIATKDGKLDAKNIKGYMTLKDISEVYKIDLNVLYNKLGITKEQVPEDTMIKNAGKLLGKTEEEFSPEIVRQKVAELLGQTLENNIEEKHEDLNKNVQEKENEKTLNINLNKEEVKNEKIENKSVVTKQEERKNLESQKNEQKNEKVEVVDKKIQETKPDPQEIRGMMTLREVADIYNVDINELYKIIGKTKEEIPENTKLKEIKDKVSGFEVQIIRDKVKELQK